MNTKHKQKPRAGSPAAIRSVKWLPWSYVIIGAMSAVNAAYMAPGPWSKACGVAVTVIILCRMALEWDSPNSDYPTAVRVLKPVT